MLETRRLMVTVRRPSSVGSYTSVRLTTPMPVCWCRPTTRCLMISAIVTAGVIAAPIARSRMDGDGLSPCTDHTAAAAAGGQTPRQCWAAALLPLLPVLTAVSLAMP